MKLGKSLCILISGRAGTGKDLVSHLLITELEIKFERVLKYSFATPIKEFANASFGWDMQKDDKGRRLLQGLGKLGREYDQDIWARKLFLKVRRDSPDFPPDVVVIPDWRFPNELDYAQKMNEYKTVTIRIEAPSRERLKGTEAYNDVSETSLPSGVNGWYNYIIYNDDLTLEQLNSCVKEIVKSILEKEKEW